MGEINEENRFGGLMKNYSNAVIWSDLHFPYADEKAVNTILKFSKDVKPTHHIFIGDCLNLGGISRYVEDDLIAQYEEPVIAGLIGFANLINRIRKINPKSKIVWIIGNHSERLKAFVRKHPAWRGLIDQPLTLLTTFGKCKYSDINIIRFKDPEETYALGKMNFTHGFYIGKHTASQHVEAFGENITFGHSHTMQMFTTVKKGVIPVAAYCIGHLMDKRGREYLKGAPHRWVTGFAYLEFNNKTGIFTQHLLPIVKDGFFFAGKYYKG